MTIHISLDIETWGTEPGCDIRSIGACVFSPETGLVHDGSLGTIKPFYIACDNPYKAGYPPAPDGLRKYPLHRDERTVQWWSEQSDEAQAAFANPVDLRYVLERFSDWIGDMTDGEPTTLHLWSHGAHFDGPILAAAYRACDLPVPWHYRAPRDTRTCFDMAGIDDHSAWLAQFSGDDRVQHHALSDAVCQARAVCGAMERIREPVRIAEQFGDRVCDVFDQMQKGNWRDDLDHDVRMNKSMLSLKDALEQAVAWRESLQ